jgi:hypothetical protein
MAVCHSMRRILRRTIGKKEIDFILKPPDGPLPVEAKNHFPRTTPPVLKSIWQTASLDAASPLG